MSQSATAYEIIEPGNNLRAKVKEISRKNAGEDPIARAEAALSALSRHFDGWMEEAVSGLSERCDQWAAVDYKPGEARSSFFRAAHDLKGQGATLGFPLITHAAAGLCMLLSEIGDDFPPPVKLIEIHVDAIRAILREKVHDEDHPLGHALITMLDDVARACIAEHERVQASTEV